VKKIFIISSLNRSFFEKYIRKIFFFYNHKKVNEKKLVSLCNKKSIIFSVASGYILKKKLLKKFNKHNLINIHPGSCNYPGRDSYHFACLKTEDYFGAVIHYMSEKVDNGEIIDEYLVKIKKNSSYKEYQKASIKCAKILFEKYFMTLLKENKKIKNIKKNWSQKIYKRKDLIKMFKISKKISKKELDLRIKSFYTKYKKSLYINLHGYNFYIKK
jgi:methionyl-tRNA formyltransferase